jgi:hypothetical protein
MQEIFRTRIAGHFPFAPGDAAADAAPADIVDFMRAWDAVAPSAPDLAGISGPAAPRLNAFFADMAATRKFFASLVDSASALRPPMYDYQVDFRVNRGREINANQIAEWSAQFGARLSEVGSPVAARRGRWSAGDSVLVELRWATGSPFMPVSVIGAGATVADGAVEIGAGGTWGLLRLVRAFESDVPDPEGGSTISIAVRTARKAMAADATGTARAFMRVRFYDPDTKAELRLPRFPQALPSLPTEGSR